MTIFEIDSDIRKARTLSSSFYTGEGFFNESTAKIFARSWQFVGTADDVNNLRPHTILEGFLDEPILLVRDGTSVSCLSNVCTHRGKLLVEKPCDAKLIRCAYHGRRFALDGNFLSMPEFESVENFPSEKDNLSGLPVAMLGNLLFVSIDPVAQFEDFISELRERLDWFDFGKLKYVGERVYTVKAHWALYCENYLEGFHIPFIHQALNSVVNYDTYSTDVFSFSSLQTARAKNDENAFELPEASPDCGKKIAAYYFFIFPNLMLNFYPWGLSVNIVKPVTPALTKVSFLTFVSDESKLDQGAGAELHTVELEDEAAVESVQRGIRSRFYESGRYSPSREQGTHHFHRLIAKFMKKA